MKDIKLEVVWTTDITKKEIINYVEIQKCVFNIDYSIEKFQKKFFDNIYGASLIILVCLEKKYVGAMTFWRNDIEGMKAYQPCEMAVLMDARGHGIFSRMNKEGLKYIEEDTLLYNFPNDNSLPYYKKIKWDIYSRKRYKLFNPITNLKEIMKIDKKYIEWLLNDTNLKNIETLKYTCIKKRYYLLKKRTKNVYIIIGEIQKRNAKKIKKAKLPILLHYSSKGYCGRGVVTVTRYQNKDMNIPLYKIGPLF